MIHFDDDIWSDVEPHEWKWRRRTVKPTLIEIHATRSGIAGRTAEQDYGSTLNWAKSPTNIVTEDNGYEWGSIENVVVGGGKVGRVLPRAITCHYSLGHADPLALSLEIAQATNDTAFEERDLENGAEIVASWCLLYDIPPRILPYLSGDNHEAPGLVRHDRSANGDHWGKSDPGTLFDDDAFERRVQRYMIGEDDDMVQIVREEGSPYCWLTNGVSRSYLRDKAHSDALGIPWVVKVLPKGTLASVARLDDLT